MSPLRGRKIRRLYINSDNCNEGASNRINNLGFEFSDNCGFYDENVRYNHLRKLSKVAAGLNIPHLQTNNGIVPLDNVSFSNGGIHIKTASTNHYTDNQGSAHTVGELKSIAFDCQGDKNIIDNASNFGVIQASNSNHVEHFSSIDGDSMSVENLRIGRGCSCSDKNCDTGGGINMSSIYSRDRVNCENSEIDFDPQESNHYIKNLTPMQIKYLKKTRKLLSYELPQYESGIKQLLSIPEYLPCDM